MARDNTPPGVAQAILDQVGLQFVATARAAVDPASVAAEATGGTAVTVAGAVLGDFVLAAPETADLLTVNAGIHVYVSDANEVTINVSNNTVAAGAAVDLASATWTFLVLRRTRAS